LQFDDSSSEFLHQSSKIASYLPLRTFITHQEPTIRVYLHYTHKKVNNGVPFITRECAWRLNFRLDTYIDQHKFQSQLSCTAEALLGYVSANVLNLCLNLWKRPVVKFLDSHVPVATMNNFGFSRVIFLLQIAYYCISILQIFDLKHQTHKMSMFAFFLATSISKWNAVKNSDFLLICIKGVLTFVGDSCFQTENMSSNNFVCAKQ